MVQVRVRIPLVVDMSWCEYYGNTEPKKKMLSQFLRARRHPYPTRQESRSAAGFAASRLVARAHSPESCLRWNNASHLHDRHHMEHLLRSRAFAIATAVLERGIFVGCTSTHTERGPIASLLADGLGERMRCQGSKVATFGRSR